MMGAIFLIDGNKIKSRRRELGMSQGDLAQGITTQATVSLLERNRAVPKSDVLSRLAIRLGIELNDLIIGEDNSVSIASKLDEADAYCMNYQYDEVLQIVRQLKNIVEPEQKAHALFLETDALMWQTRNYDDAIFGFNRILELHDHRADVYIALATCELGVVYSLKEGNHDKASYYFDQLPALMSGLQLDKQVFWTLFLWDDLSKYYANTGKSQKCLALLDQALAFAKKHRTVLFVDQLHFLMATETRNNNHGWNELSLQHLIAAYAFATSVNNSVIEKKARAYLLEQDIALSSIYK